MSKDISQKILDATLEVIAREKISGTRMHLIAKEAEMTQSNLHYYFPTKDQLLIALLDEIQAWFSSTRQRGIQSEGKGFDDNLHTIFAEKQDVILNHKKLDYVQFDYWVQGTVNPEVRETFRKMFDIWRADIRGVLDQGGAVERLPADALELIPFLMVSLMMGASMQYLIDEDKFDLGHYFALAETMIRKLLEHGMD